MSTNLSPMDAPQKDLPLELNQIPNELTNYQPGTLRVIKRNGKVVSFDLSKIIVAMTKAFLAVTGTQAAASSSVYETVNHLANDIHQTFLRRLPSGGSLRIEEIQDQVELMLMRKAEHHVARAYVLYREERNRERQATHSNIIVDSTHLQTTLRNGEKAPLDNQRLAQIISEACLNLTDVDPDHIYQETLRNIFDGIPIDDVAKAAQLSGRALIEKDPNYSYVSARLLLDDLRGEALRFLNIQESATYQEIIAIYPTYFKSYLQKGIELELLSPELLKFDLIKIDAALKPERDLQFTYLGLQTLYDRYFIHSEGTRFELPQAFFMRVAMGLALNEANKEEAAIEFYDVLSSFDYMASTPTLFNSGTLRPQLSSCFLTTVPDDLDGIYDAYKQNALLSKYAGGLGNDWTPVRAMNSYIKGTNGKSQGVVPFMNVANASAVAVNQGGKRKGAVAAYLETWHLDIEEFLELRKNTGDERRRTHDMNTVNWIPDLFMERVFADAQWTLFSPSDLPHLHDLYGKAFKTAYIEAEAKAARGEIRLFKKISAVTLWRKMLGMLFETGHPWMTFKDPCNLRSPQQHCGVVHSSNLCTEITLNTSSTEVAVCNLGSINLPHMLNEHGLDIDRLQRTVRTAIRMLDNVIDINYYCIPEAKNANQKHRPIGLGLMGFQDALYQLQIPYASQKAVDFADLSMEYLSYFAIEASSALAVERGSYESFDGSLWSKGILPIHSIQLLKETRGDFLDQNTDQHLDWAALQAKVMKQGMRNSNTMAIAPTATISNICGVSQSIEPTYQNLFVKSNMSGEFTVVNPYLVRDLKALHLWDEVMVNDLKYFNGTLKSIQRIPDSIKALYATAFEIEPRWLVDAASRRQKWIDQAQSLNIYMAEPSGKKLDILYRMAWVRGLKTTYYLRSQGATAPEKSTIHDGSLNAVKTPLQSEAPKACSIADPDCEACQ